MQRFPGGGGANRCASFGEERRGVTFLHDAQKSCPSCEEQPRYAVKRNSRPMSRVLCFAVQSVRHLSGCAVADTFYRSTLRRFSEENRTSRPPTSVYMNFQLPKCTACRVTTVTGGLLPHLLTLTGVRCETLRRRLFSSARVRLHRRLPIKKRNALCCPDFPHASHECGRRTVRLFLFCLQK